MVGVRDAWRALFQKDDAPKSRPMRGEIGYTGNKIFSGLPMDEYNPDLAFPESTAVYDQMRRSDGQVAAVLSAIKLPIRSAKWYVEPEKDAKDEKLAEQIADFIDDNLLHGMRYSWDDHLREALLMLDFGFSVFERVYRFDTWNGRPVILLDKYAPRVAQSIWRFPQDEATGDIVAVEQLNYYTGQLYSIPLGKCRIYTFNREGDNPVGISALRAAYKHWYYKDSLYKIMAVGTEKSLIGTPYAKMPQGASDEDRNKVLNVLTAIRAAEEAGFTLPAEVELAVLEGTRNAMDPMPLLEHHDTLIARSVLGQFLNLGTMSSASGGSYALGQTQVSLFIQGLEAIANYIQEEIQSDIEQLVEWNFGADAPMPRLRHGLITIESVAEQMVAIGALGAGHLVNPDESLENHLRNMMGLPPITKATLDNQLLMPANRYEPEIIPNHALTPQMAADAARAQVQAKAPGMVQGATAIKATEIRNAVRKALFELIESDIGSVDLNDDPNEVPFTFADDGGKTGGDTPVVGATNGTAQTGNWKRNLTVFESEDAILRLDNEWKQLEQEWITRLGKLQQTVAKDLVEQVKQVVMSRLDEISQTHTINSLQPSNVDQQTYTHQIEIIMTKAYQVGMKSVAHELHSHATPNVDAQAMAQIEAKAQLLAQNQLGRLTDAVKLAALDQLSKRAATERTITAAKRAAAQYTGNEDLKVSAMISVGEALNIGRGATAHEKGVQGAQWSAVLDDHTCPLCESLDGKTISATDPDFDVFRPPLHIGCRCFLVYVGSGQTSFEPDWKTPDPILVKQYGKLVR